MQLTRDHFFFLGVLLILLGVEFRMVESFVLNEKASQFVLKRFGNKLQQSAAAARQDLPLPILREKRPVRYTWTPPEWLGWSLISIGSVLVLHSLAMPKPSG